ncbi:MAG: glycosyl transferase group 1 [Verrucomicrobia bacterium]|nr:MAG: glycosyl transferase group 1 [Verrucomicrobiota bacterium]
MHIVHVITRLIVGGAQENTIASALGLKQKADVRVSLISGPASGPEGSLQDVFAEHPGLLMIVPALVRPIHPWNDFLVLRRLRKIFREQKPDIVHTHSGKAGVLGRLAAARAGVPIIVHTIHGPSFGPFQGAIANALFRRAELVAGRVTTHFVTVADAMRDQYLAAGIGRPQQYTTVYSGFDLEPFLTAKNDPDLRARFGIGVEDVVVGKIARLFKLKGHDDLMDVAPEVVRNFPKIKFLLVGDGNLRSRLEARARALGLERQFIFTGLVQPGQVAQLVGIMDMVIHLSAREGLARALPQALAAAKPVIAYDCDGAREVCIRDETGFLLRRGDKQGLSDSLVRLAKDSGMRRRLGTRGQGFVKERFAVERMVEDLYALYKRLAAERPGLAALSH